jgi:hypothetical protein
VHVDHEGGGEERRQQVEERDGEHGRDDEAAGEDRAGMTLPQPPHGPGVVEAQRRQLEIFPAEQVAVGEEEDDEPEAEQEDERQGKQVDEHDDAGEAQGREDGDRERQGAPRRVGGIVRALHDPGDLVEEEHG